MTLLIRVRPIGIGPTYYAVCPDSLHEFTRVGTREEVEQSVMEHVAEFHADDLEEAS